MKTPNYFPSPEIPTKTKGNEHSGKHYRGRVAIAAFLLSALSIAACGSSEEDRVAVEPSSLPSATTTSSPGAGRSGITVSSIEITDEQQSQSSEREKNTPGGTCSADNYNIPPAPADNPAIVYEEGGERYVDCACVAGIIDESYDWYVLSNQQADSFGFGVAGMAASGLAEAMGIANAQYNYVYNQYCR